MILIALVLTVVVVILVLALAVALAALVRWRPTLSAPLAAAMSGITTMVALMGVLVAIAR